MKFEIYNEIFVMKARASSVLLRIFGISKFWDTIEIFVKCGLRFWIRFWKSNKFLALIESHKWEICDFLCCTVESKFKLIFTYWDAFAIPSFCQCSHLKSLSSFISPKYWLLNRVFFTFQIRILAMADYHLTFSCGVSLALLEFFLS